MTIFETVRNVLARQLEISPDMITEETRILEDLGADSLDVVELIMTLEEHYNIIITNDNANELRSVGQIVDFIEKYDNEWGCNLLGDKGYSTVFDNSKIRTVVPDFKASIAYREGVKEVIDWYSHKENQIVNTDLDDQMDKMIYDYNSSIK